MMGIGTDAAGNVQFLNRDKKQNGEYSFPLESAVIKTCRYTPASTEVHINGTHYPLTKLSGLTLKKGDKISALQAPNTKTIFSLEAVVSLPVLVDLL